MSSALQDAQAKIARLRSIAADVGSQGQAPRSMPVTLQFAVDITQIIEKLAIEVEALKAELASKASP